MKVFGSKHLFGILKRAAWIMLVWILCQVVSNDSVVCTENGVLLVSKLELACSANSYQSSVVILL